MRHKEKENVAKIRVENKKQQKNSKDYSTQNHFQALDHEDQSSINTPTFQAISAIPIFLY